MFQWFFLLYSFPLNFFSVRLDTNQRLFLPKWEFFFYVLSFSDAQKLSSRHSFRYWGEININTSFIHGVFIIIFYSVEPPFFSWFILLYPICLENVSRHLERFIFWKTTFLNSNLIRAPSRHIDDGGGCKRMNIFSERGNGGGHYVWLTLPPYQYWLRWLLSETFVGRPGNQGENDMHRAWRIEASLHRWHERDVVIASTSHGPANRSAVSWIIVRCLAIDMKEPQRYSLQWLIMD